MAREMQGKVCMVTGANSGIGRVMALELAKMDADVVMACRSRERGEDARSYIIDKSGNDKVELLLADFRSMNEVRGLAAEFKKTHENLHVLVNNAAIVPRRRRVTPDGFEEQFQVNHLSYFLLTHLLLDSLKAGAPSRIVNVSSEIHKRGSVDFDNLQSEKSYKSFDKYGTTKLMNLHFTYELARKLEGTGVSVNAFTPGFCRTRLGRDSSAVGRFFVWLLAKSAEKGARPGIYLATSPELKATTGKYFSKMNAIRSSEESYDMEITKRLWSVSEKIAGLENFWNPS
jgi:NAD(P)-dependent dehydrogenase (short-subunit alcohol dehydrogenase family)